MCVVSEPYPALTFQAGHFLEYKTTARIQPPLVADVFLIDVLAEMLSTPLQFLSYVNRRVTYHEKILTPDELAVLALHLRENLWVEEDTDKVAILDQGTWDLDVAMMVRRAGMPGKATPDGVLTRLTGTLVGSVLAQIEAEPNPAAIELGLVLLKLGESVVQQIDTVVDGWRNCPNRDGMYGFSMSISGADTGLTLLANCLPQRETEIYAANTCLVRKYESRVTTWFGVVLDGRDFTTLRHVRVVSYTWEADEALAKAARRFGGKRVR